MAFTSSNSNVRSMNGGAANNENKPDAYLNVYLPKRGGQRAKLGAFKLWLNKKTDGQIIEHLRNAPNLEEALEQMKERLELDFYFVTDEVTQEDELMLG